MMDSTRTHLKIVIETSINGGPNASDQYRIIRENR